MTDEGNDPGDATLFPKTVGERLRDARLAQKLELADVAQRTRVPLRHLQAIEDGDYSGMPTATYAVGFARAYARAVGVDEVEVAREVRGRSEVSSAARRPEFQGLDIEDTPRTASRGVMIATLVIAALVVLGVLGWAGSNWFRGDGASSDPIAATPGFTPEATPTAAPPPVINGQVTLVATDEVWVRVYDSANRTLKLGTMAAGERFDVPIDAAGPMINVGRPDKLQVLVNGSPVAPLGDGRVAIKDVPIGAAALAARNQPAPTATGAPPPTAAASPPVATVSPGPRAIRAVPPFFRGPAPQPTRTQAAPASTGQRDTPPAAATPIPAATPPGNGF